MQVQVYNGGGVNYNLPWLEQALLQISDVFEIRIVWDCETAVLTSVMAVAGGLIGGYAGGRLGAALGAGIGSATGLTVSTVISLREAWARVKEELQEVLYILYNYLRRLDTTDYLRAFDILMSCASSRRELVFNIVAFIADKLSRDVLSNVSTHSIR